jgi:hypothetical protein
VPIDSKGRAFFRVPQYLRRGRRIPAGAEDERGCRVSQIVHARSRQAGVFRAATERIGKRHRREARWAASSWEMSTVSSRCSRRADPSQRPNPADLPAYHCGVPMDNSPRLIDHGLTYRICGPRLTSKSKRGPTLRRSSSSTCARVYDAMAFFRCRGLTESRKSVASAWRLPSLERFLAIRMSPTSRAGPDVRS